MTPAKLTKLLTRIFGPRHDVQAAELFGVSSRMIQYYKTGARRIPERIADLSFDLEAIGVAIEGIKKDASRGLQ